MHTLLCILHVTLPILDLLIGRPAIKLQEQEYTIELSSHSVRPLLSADTLKNRISESLRTNNNITATKIDQTYKCSSE